ncbi:hypothetical protein Tco_1197529, partial [Tanacetum coccineum]
MLTMAENVIVAGADNRPHMLDKTQYSSWVSRMLLYIKGKEHGSEISLHERESKLYDDFDTFISVSEETTHSYYLRFAQLINDMLTIGTTMKPIQVNTKFINHLQPKWSKFMTDVKFAKDLYNTKFDHLYGYLRQREAHTNEGCDTFLPSDDVIASLNKAMDFISTTFTSHYPPTNNQLRTSSNPRNQATIQDGRVTVQTVHGRQTQGYAGSSARSNATGTRVNKNGGTNTAGQAK